VDMKSKKYLIRFILFSLFLSNVNAADSDRGKIYQLAENIRSILWRSDPVPENFELTQEESDRAVAYSELEAEISDFAYSTNGSREVDKQNPCPPVQDVDENKDKLALQDAIDRREFSIYYTGTFASEDALAQAEGVYGRHNYRSFMMGIYSRGNNGAKTINSLEKLENSFLNSDDAPDDFDSLSALEQSQLLQKFAQDKIGQDVSLGLILSEYAIDSMIDSPGDWKSSLNEIKGHLSFEEKIKIASHFGGEFADRYNNDRAADVGDAGEGIVTIEQMLHSISSNEPGGICRDVALAQSQILRELGVDHDDIYMIGYKTATGGHAILAIDDPENPGNLVKLNYSYVTQESEISGGAQLTQDTTLPDIGINYRVYDADGKPVGNVPTEVGQIFKDVTNQKSYDVAKSYTLQKAYVETPIGTGTVFTGRTSAGDNLVGVAINKKVEQGLWENEYGLALAKREGERTVVSIDQEALYARVNTRLNTPQLSYGDNFSMNGFAGMNLEGMVANTRVTNKEIGTTREGTGIDAMTTFYMGAEGEWNSEDGNTTVTSEVVASSYIDWKNEVNTTEGQTLALDNVRWTTGVEHGVTDSMRVMGEGTIIMRQVGSSAIISGGLRNERTGLSIDGAYQAPLSNSLPSFMNGATHSFSTGVTKDWKDEKGRGPTFNLYYEKDLDYENDRVGGNVGWKW